MKKFYTLILMLSAFFSSNAQLLDTYDISGSANGIIAMPYTQGLYSTFTKYTKIQAPNGQAIHFVAQNALTDAQIVRARNILQFYLTNVPGSQYGSDKTAVINAMGTNEATLMLLNGADGSGANPPEIATGQTLYQNELPVEGDSWYITNNYTHRDAAFEEILHMMHDYGIGVDTNGTPSTIGALPAYQAEIRAAQDNADNNFAIWPIGETITGGWYAELAAENSLSQEYLASVVDSYYGLWEAWNEAGNPASATTGMWGLYIAKTRAEEQTEDPMGYALMPKYFSPFININFDIDPTFTGIFNMTRTPAQPYTYKSQYLQDITLTGTNASGIKGNAQPNVLNGNDSNNTIEGAAGNDTVDCKGGTGDKVIFTGSRAEYTITVNSGIITIQDNTANRDGTDTATNCEILKFVDQEVAASTLNVDNFSVLNSFKMYPNPVDNELNFDFNNTVVEDFNVKIYDLNGRLILSKDINETDSTIDVNNVSQGVYLVKLTNRNSFVTKKLIVE